MRWTTRAGAAVVLWATAALTAPGVARGQQEASGGVAGAVGASGVRADGRIEFRVRPAPSAITVDGDLDEAAWADAEVIPLRWETDPGENVPAPVETECRVTFDAERLYFGCHAWDPDPSAIRAYITDRDRIDGQDRIVFAVDPFNDSRRAFEFLVNPLGVQGDRFYDEQRGFPDDSWDAIWASAGKIVEDGYRIEAAIPFESLRFPGRDGVQTWGAHVRRVWPRSERVQTRSLRLDRSDGCLLCQANVLVGFREISPGRNVEVVPTLTASRSDGLAGAPLGDGLEAGEIEAEPGVDLRWSPSPDLALNATLNPDFSQVEADAAQLDVNNRFALFFPERRPFFLEGADLFRTPIRAVFTRTIADPVGGTKLTGKSGGWAGGVLLARDRLNNLLLPGNQSSARASLDRGVTSAIGRLRRDVGESSTVGALYTGRVGAGGYFNHVGGVDAFLRPVPSLGVRLQYLRSRTRYPDSLSADRSLRSGEFTGNAVELRADWRTRNWNAGVDFGQRDPGFRADAGFLRRVDVRRMGIDAGRTIWGDGDGWFTRLRIQGGVRRSENLAGRLNDDALWSWASWEGPLQSQVWVNPFLRREFFDGRVYDLAGFWSGASIRPSGRVRLGLRFRTGDAIDFAHGREADEVAVTPEVSLRVGRGTELSLDHTLQRLRFRGRTVFTANLSELRGVHNFSPRAFVRVVAQYRRTDRNPTLHEAEVDPERTSLFTQLLFSYKLNPLTALFVGYTDDRTGFVDAGGVRTELSPAGRTFFFKVGYAWRP